MIPSKIKQYSHVSRRETTLGQRKSYCLVSRKKEFGGLWNEKLISPVSKSACNFVKYFVSSQSGSGHLLSEKLGMLEPSFNRSGLPVSLLLQ